MTTSRSALAPHARATALAAPGVDWREVARLILTSRAIDHIEETELVPSGKLAYQFSARGHDLALDHPRDAAAIYYRSRPFVLASGQTLEESFASTLARQGGMTNGRDVGVMMSLLRRERALVLPASGDVGSQYTPAAGWAQAAVPLGLYQAWAKLLYEEDFPAAVIPDFGCAA